MLFHETVEGWWMRSVDGVAVKPGTAPADLVAGEKWIDVNLTTQSLVAFQGDKAVYATLVSTGKVDKVNKEKNHETPKGTFRIREKHIAATMDGDVASDGPYSIEDVPWIMYFNGSYALRGGSTCVERDRMGYIQAFSDLANFDQIQKNFSNF